MEYNPFEENRYWHAPRMEKSLEHCMMSSSEDRKVAVIHHQDHNDFNRNYNWGDDEGSRVLHQSPLIPKFDEESCGDPTEVHKDLLFSMEQDDQKVVNVSRLLENVIGTPPSSISRCSPAYMLSAKRPTPKFKRDKQYPIPSFARSSVARPPLLDLKASTINSRLNI